MKVYVNRITGIDDAIVSMFMSKRTWTRELENQIRSTCFAVLDDYDGKLCTDQYTLSSENFKNFKDWMDKLTKWGQHHITMLRFIDLSITVEGLHRAGQDDWDAHAMRYNNRIIRTSTRMSQFAQNEMSTFYQGKIMPTDMALKLLSIDAPDKFIHEGKTYIKTVNGYVDEEYADNQDVKRGLYMLSIPSNFIFKVNLTEWAHVYKERNNSGRANPEVKECCESIADALGEMMPWFDRDLFLAINN